MEKPEPPLVLSVLVQEDLAMAVYLPLVGVLLRGGGTATIALSVSIAIAVVFGVLFVAVRYGHQLSQFVAHESDEIILLTIFGTVLLVAGVAQRFQVSAAIGAFLVGIALSGSVAEQSHRLVSPLRDLFAAIFFFFFGLEIDPTILVPALPFAVGLGAVTTLTKVLTGYWAARRAGIDSRGRLRAGMELIARGEFSIVIAGLGVAIEPRLGPLSAAYVLIMAMLGTLPAGFLSEAGCKARVVSPVANSLQPGDSNFNLRPSTSRWNFTAFSMSATNLIAYLSCVSCICASCQTECSRDMKRNQLRQLCVS